MFYLVGCCSYRGRSEIKCPVFGPERLKAIILTPKLFLVCSSFSFAAGSHNDRIMPMSDTVSSEGRRPRASNKALRPCPLRSEISPVSLNLLMILCTVEDEICKAFAIWHWGTLSLKYSTIFLCTLSQIGEPLPIFISERICLSKTSL